MAFIDNSYNTLLNPFVNFSITIVCNETLIVN